MRRSIYFTILGAGLLAGVFGVVMDQVTVTISPEYFRIYKELPGETPGQLRLAAADLGFASGMVPGLIAGLCLASTVLDHSDDIGSTRRLLSMLWIPVVLHLVLSPIFATVQALMDPGGLRDSFKLGSPGNVTRMLVVLGIHQSAYVSGFIGVALATVLARRTGATEVIGREQPDQFTGHDSARM